MNIRNQFGEKVCSPAKHWRSRFAKPNNQQVAFYFAYLQNYLLWLAGPAVLGLLITISGAQSLSVWYSLAMLVWSVVFIEVWKRKEQEIAVAWNVRNCSKHEKRRLEFKGDRTVTDQVTGEEMPYCPLWKLFMRRALSVPGVALGAVALSIIVTCVFVLQLFLHEYYAGPFRQILVRCTFQFSVYPYPCYLVWALALCTDHWLCFAYPYNVECLLILGPDIEQLGDARNRYLMGVPLYAKDLRSKLFSLLLVLGRLAC